MAVTPRSLLLVGLAAALVALAGCRTTRRSLPSCRPAPVCLPPLEAPAAVGTEVGEIASKDFVLRVYDVRDILDLMPVMQRVGAGGVRTEPPEDALIAGVVQGLGAQERSYTEVHATDSGAVIVKGPPTVQAKVADALHRYRIELVRAQVGTTFPEKPAGDR